MRDCLSQVAGARHFAGILIGGDPCARRSTDPCLACPVGFVLQTNGSESADFWLATARCVKNPANIYPTSARFGLIPAVFGAHSAECGIRPSKSGRAPNKLV